MILLPRLPHPLKVALAEMLTFKDDICRERLSKKFWFVIKRLLGGESYSQTRSIIKC